MSSSTTVPCVHGSRRQPRHRRASRQLCVHEALLRSLKRVPLFVLQS
jgi:hypothetical protein